MLHRPDAGFATAISAQQEQALRLVQTIPLPGVTGRLDHMGVDLEKKRLFVAAVRNNTLEVVDLAGGKVIESLAGFKDTQDALFLGGDFNKLYVSSLDGHVRVFQGESFRRVQDFKASLIRTVFSMILRPISLLRLWRTECRFRCVRTGGHPAAQARGRIRPTRRRHDCPNAPVWPSRRNRNG
jgi:hypothetical protein